MNTLERSCAGDHVHRLVNERTWQAEGMRIHIDVCTGHRAVLVMAGKGTVHGARKLVDMVDTMHDELGHGIVITALVDMRHLHGAPMRAQAIVLKRLVEGRHQIARAAIVSASAFEMAAARTILGVAGLGGRTQLTRGIPEAVRFLEWPEHRYAG